MNKTEQRYADGVLRPLALGGKLIDWEYEAFKLRLGADWKSTLTPDFWLVWPDRFEIVEIKGHQEDDAMAKFRAAARIFPWWSWRMVEWKGGQWRTILEF